MRVTELKALARDRGLRNYSRMRKAELVALLQNNPPPAPRSGAPSGLPQISTWELIDDRLRPDIPALRRLKQPPHSVGSVTPSPQEMDIFK